MTDPETSTAAAANENGGNPSSDTFDTTPEPPLPMRVIKTPDQTGMSIRRLFEGSDLRLVKARVLREIREVQAALQAAADEARRITDRAGEDAVKIRASARDEGLRQSHQEMLSNLARARAEYGLLQERAESDMLDLAFNIARRLIGHAIEVEPEVVGDIVARSLELVRGRRQIVVFVHPDDRRVLESMRNQLVQEVDGVPVHFDEDETVERGGCIIETESGRIDARLDVQLELLRNALVEG